jgi:hypothetical protein
LRVSFPPYLWFDEGDRVMEICYVINDLAPVGAQTAVHDLVCHVVDRDVAATVCYFEGDTPLTDSLADAGADVVGLHSHSKFDIPTMGRLLGIFQQTDFDLVHARLPYSQVIARLLATVISSPPSPRWSACGTSFRTAITL